MFCMAIVPKQQSLLAYHFEDEDHFVGLLKFVKGNEGGKIEGTLKIDGPALQALISIPGATLKVNRYEWLIRNQSGTYKTMSDTEFQQSYQRAA